MCRRAGVPTARTVHAIAQAVRKSELFKQRWVEDACIAYLSQRQVAASNAPGAALGASAPPGPSMA